MKLKFVLIFFSSFILAACDTSSTPLPSITPTSSPTVILSPTSAPSQPTFTQKTLHDLLSLGKSQKCTYQTTQNGQTVTNTIYLKDNKFRQVSGEVTTISDGNFVYSYSSVSASGAVKIKIDQSVSTNSIDLNKSIDYQCSPADVSDSDFSLPPAVKFTELNQNLQNLNQNIQDKIKDAFDQFIPLGE